MSSTNTFEEYVFKSIKSSYGTISLRIKERKVDTSMYSFINIYKYSKYEA
jgi:hypothetical protein